MLRVSVLLLSPMVIVALVSACVVELSTQAEQNVDARISSEYVIVPVSPVSIFWATPPLASTTLVGAGWVVSIVMTRPTLDDEPLPAASVAVAVIVCAPVVRVE